MFPQWCIGCGRGGDILCYSCRQQFLPVIPPVCPRCGLPQVNGQLCLNCSGWQAAIDGIRSPYQFDGVAREAVHQLKYRNLRILAVPLAKLLYDFLKENPLPAEVIIAVPLHPKRLRERGYNQSQLLAEKLSRLSGLPVMDDCLARAHYTMPQARTGSVAERRSNIAGAFLCRNGKVKNRQVLLIDDVATTGATLNSCADVLKAAGAAGVWGLTFAREI
ncbi:MAG: ComF family protein [Dehalococcoidales bacterium]|nr:ComF family protein [Dehalococcoidales bacterium]